MKKSKYNLIFNNGEKILAFNSRTCALAEVDEEFIYILNNIENINKDSDCYNKELIDNMLLGNYIVEDAVDELKVIQFKHLSGKYREMNISMVIAPTLACNFGCPYCYETEKKGVMSIEIQDKIIKLVKKYAKNKRNIGITWYGGEPLLGVQVIRDMSKRIVEICEKYEVDFFAYMVTNGYLMTSDILNELAAAKITGYQITLDGPPDIHNSRRMLKNNNKGTFDVVLSNILNMVEKGISDITIRVNIDKTNTNSLEELLDILISKGLQKKVSLSLGHVNAYTEACASISDGCLDVEEYAMNTLEHQKILFKKGFNVEDFPYYPGIKENYCCADSMSSHVIDPEGYLYKCWNDVGRIDKAVGSVSLGEGEIDSAMYMKNVEYLSWTPFDHAECLSCNVLPICMGGCPYNGIANGNKPLCEKWKYNLEDTLILAYDQGKK